jgi:hypothetical protein
MNMEKSYTCIVLFKMLQQSKYSTTNSNKNKPSCEMKQFAALAWLGY